MRFSLHRGTMEPPVPPVEEHAEPESATDSKPSWSPFSVECNYVDHEQPLGNFTIVVKGLLDLTDYRHFTCANPDHKSFLRTNQVSSDELWLILHDYSGTTESPLIQEVLNCFPEDDQRTLGQMFRELAEERQQWYDTQEPQTRGTIIYPPRHERKLYLAPDMAALSESFRALFERHNTER